MVSVNLAARDFGTAGRPPLILLHGLLGSSRNWQTVGRDLSAHFHVYALDLRNHGSSPHADEMSYDVLVADVLAWLDLNGLASVTLLGHSLGGKVAMSLACRHPERVERLIVVDIAPKDYRSNAHRAEFAAMNELDLSTLRSRGEAELRFEARVPDGAMRKFLTTNLDRTDLGGWQWSIPLPALTRALPELEKNPLRSTDRFEAPTHFILGGKSRYVSIADEGTLAPYFPSIRVTRLADAGHNPHMETREAFVHAVLLADGPGD